MSWFISGTGRDLVFQVSERGYASCHGRGIHKCLPPQNDYNPFVDMSTLRRIQEAQIQWSLNLSDDLERPFVKSFAELSESLKNSPGDLHYIVNFFPDDLDQVEFSFFAPSQVFEKIQNLLQLVLQNNTLTYAISFPFLGFPIESSATSLPTWDEFIAGKPYISSRYSFVTQRNREDDERTLSALDV